MPLFSSKPDEAAAANGYGLAKLPPGQLLTAKFPVMTYGPTPIIETDAWQLRIGGAVRQNKSWSWDEFMALPQTTLVADFHCVTHWSRFDDEWTGVMFRDLYDSIRHLVQPSAAFVLQRAYGGYTTNLPLRWMLDEDVMIAHTFNGQPLPPEHGGPVRIFTPKRYAWKGAKWIHALDFLENDQPGFWEQNGYSNSANPWNEERYWE
ncbi:MAG: sulfite oxidase-like oxidoreductase [Chlorobi bacterium CHB2]|nr:sulfite oxidase-like oxidoreductase [Chlorobi bacterium CHB2]